ncbi:MAG: rod shape-determining protein MreC [Anaerolineaceae bacterium]
MKKISTRQWLIFTLTLFVAGIILLALSGYLNIIIGKIASPVVSIQTWVSTRYLAIHDFLTVPRDVDTLRQQNSVLENEVSQLQSQVLELQQQLSETDVLYALLDFARSKPENKYVAASVIGRDPSPFLSYIIIDHGSDDGIRKGMPVVTQQGLVGKIDAVTATASRIQLITDPGSIVNITLKNGKIDGQVAGSVTGDLSLARISSSVSLIEGDLAITNGLGGTYPSDIVVGQILSPSKGENDLFQSAVVQPVVDFTNLKAVLIITNFTPVDISPLIPETTN